MCDAAASARAPIALAWMHGSPAATSAGVFAADPRDSASAGVMLGPSNHVTVNRASVFTNPPDSFVPIGLLSNHGGDTRSG